MKQPKLCAVCGKDTMGHPYRLVVAGGRPRRVCPGCGLAATSEAFRRYQSVTALPMAVARRAPKATNVTEFKKRARGGER